MLSEAMFAILGLLFLLTGLRTFLASLYQLLFGTLPNNTIGIIAIAVFAAAALAPLLARRYGSRRAVGASALALAVATVAATVSRDAWLDLGFSVVAVVAGSWWLTLVHASRPGGRPSPLPVALPVAIVCDFALRHAFRTVPVVDLMLGLALLLVGAAALVFVAATLATIAEERSWTAPGWRGMVALGALPPLIMLGETGGTNAAQIALAAGIGWGPEPARSTQIGAVIAGVGLSAGAAILTRDLPHRAVAAAALAAGAAVLWLRLPVVSLLGGAAFACGLIVASVVLAGAPGPGRGARRTALPLAVGWVLFVVIGFAYHALYLEAALWAAAAAVAAAVLLAPAVPGPRLGIGQAAMVAVLALAVPGIALLSLRAPAPVQAPPTLRVMTYNVHQGFDAFQVPSLDRLTETIAREAPDVLVLQEVVRGWVIDQQHDVLGVLAERLGMSYVYQGTVNDLYGNAILSKLPMTDVRRILFPREAALRHQQRGAIAVRVAGVLVIATHLDQHDDASVVRQRQMRELLRLWDGGSPALIVGDLNAVAESAELRLLEQAGFNDLAHQAGTDEPTYPAQRPERRIDYIWGIGVTGSEARAVASTASDHRAVVVNVTRSATR